MITRSTGFALLLSLCVCCIAVNSFLLLNPRQAHAISIRTRTRFASVGDDSDSFSPKEKSSMPGYMADFLAKSRTDPQDQYTHMIGFPLEDAHELLLQLESVQRAIIHKCPVLVRSAIVPVMTRLPMLYVDARNSKLTQQQVTAELHSIVQSAIQKHLINANEDSLSNIQDGDIDPLDESEFMRGPNKEGHCPLVLTFEKLEMDGDDNEVLLTVAKDDSQTELLRTIQNDMMQQIALLGIPTSMPPDPHCTTEKSNWRPRVAFMRLPPDFTQYLPEVEDEDLRKPEQGGNGISPIFWCEWWDDVFSQNTRLYEVGVYARQPNSLGVNEKAFYMPHETLALPSGNSALTKEEARHAKYQQERMMESEKEIDGLVNMDDIPDVALEEAREELEALFEEGTAEINEQTGVSQNVDESISLDEWTRERIRKAVEERDSVKARKEASSPKPEPVPMEDNPVFKKYREQRDKRRNEEEQDEEEHVLPPWPSREHFVGAWNFVSSPLTSFSSDGDQMDNIILRVDGTTFGGPILDLEHMHKAAGGTWKMTTESDDARLRIRLVIPPAKERILVMEGQVTRLEMPSNMQQARSSFGIPVVEDAIQNSDITNRYNDVLQCDGKIWKEDAVTGKNREDLGVFTLIKMENQKPNDYVITIPRSVRNLD